MPKKKPGMTPEEQSKKFKAEVERLVKAGQLDPEEAGDALDKLVRKSGAR